jgi:hypothetical protein
MTPYLAEPRCARPAPRWPHDRSLAPLHTLTSAPVHLIGVVFDTRKWKLGQPRRFAFARRTGATLPLARAKMLRGPGPF